MTGIDFPSNPSVNQQFSAFGNVWVWNGSSWRKVSRTAVVGAQGNTGQTGPQGATGAATASSSAPTSATSTGTAGTIAYDSNYVYICVATNTWRRVAISSW